MSGLVNGLGTCSRAGRSPSSTATAASTPASGSRCPGAARATLELTADAVVLAPGSLPRTLPGFEVDGTLVMTSDEVLSMPEVPKRAAIIGGGVIGCEFASMMSDLGTEVTILEALPKILPGLDKDLTQVIERSFKKRGMTIRTGVKVERPHARRRRHQRAGRRRGARRRRRS